MRLPSMTVLLLLLMRPGVREDVHCDNSARVSCAPNPSRSAPRPPLPAVLCPGTKKIRRVITESVDVSLPEIVFTFSRAVHKSLQSRYLNIGI